MQKEHVKSGGAKKTQQIILKNRNIKTANGTEVEKSKSKGDQANKWKHSELKQETEKENLKSEGDKEREEIIKSVDRGWVKEDKKF